MRGLMAFVRTFFSSALFLRGCLKICAVKLLSIVFPLPVFNTSLIFDSNIWTQDS